MYDLIIVGAGPAGLATALTLRESGLKILLLEKSTFPRDKICGDALSVDVINQLYRINEDLGNAFQKLEAKTQFSGLKMISPSGYELNLRIKVGSSLIKNGFVCKRSVFDDFLFQEAKKAECIDIKTNCSVFDVIINQDQVVVKTKLGDFLGKMVIGADGSQSVVEKKTIGRHIDKNHYCAGLRRYYKNVSGFNEGNFIELHFIKKSLPGYLWVFPLPDGEANVGIGLLSSKISKQNLNLKEIFDDVINNHPNFKHRFSQSIPLEEIKGFGLPLGSMKKKLYGNRFILVGDAASLIDPFSGEGIANAIRSGRIAANTVLAAHKNQNFSEKFLEQYSKMLYKSMGLEFKVSHLIQKLCKYPRVLDFVIKRARQSKRIQYFINDVMENLLKKQKITSPLFWLKLISSKM